MDISSVGSNYSDIANMLAPKNAEEIEEQSNVEAAYAVKLIKMMQASTEVVGSILEDTAEISKEAMQKFMSERA